MVATHNVFAFNDHYGVDNAKRAAGVELEHNAVAANLVADYLEFDTKMSLEDLEDESELLDRAEGDVRAEFQIPISQQWTARYAARSLGSRCHPVVLSARALSGPR